MSEKQQQPETCTIINDTSHGSVTTWFRCGETFYLLLMRYYNFTAESAMESWLPQASCVPGTVLLKDKELASDWTYGGQEQL